MNAAFLAENLQQYHTDSIRESISVRQQVTALRLFSADYLYTTYLGEIMLTFYPQA